MGVESLITVLVILLIVGAIIYLIDMIGIPAPMNWIAKEIIGLIGIIYLLRMLGAL